MIVKIALTLVSISIILVATTMPFLSNSSFAFNTTNDNNNIKSLQTKLKVVTSVAPITNIVKNIGGDKINLVGIIPEGSDSHTFELVPSDVVKMNDAILIIIDGLNLEGGMEKVATEAQNKNPNVQLLKLGDNTIIKDQWVFDFSFPKENGDPNPHLWLNVAYAIKFANLTRDKLIEMDPINVGYYSSNADKYVSLLKRLHQGIMQAIKTIPEEKRKLLTYHDSWAYFAPRYGMVVIGAVQPADFGEPTPQDVANVIDEIRREKVSAIFGSEVYPSKVIDQIGREGNVTFAQTLSDDTVPGQPTDPNHTYVGMMLEDMKNMIIPLGGNIDPLKDVNPQNTYTVG